MSVNKHFPLVFISLLLLNGCFGGSTAVPQDHYYRLPDNSQAKVLQAPVINSEVAIATFESFGLQRERSLLYIEANLPLEVKRYHYHHWSASPPRLLQENLLHYLRKIRFAPQIVRFTPGKYSTTLIKGRLLQFERLTGTDKPKVNISLELSLQVKEKRVMHKTYKRILEVETYEMHETIATFSRALQEIYHDFVTDLAQSPPGHSSTDKTRVSSQ